MKKQLTQNEKVEKAWKDFESRIAAKLWQEKPMEVTKYLKGWSGISAND